VTILSQLLLFFKWISIKYYEIMLISLDTVAIK